ncbi:adenylate cyclase [Rhizobium pisi]|jgi:adenylate cyclase|uniref:Adenylate cyclase n=2 Tax=Rhizobium TaxID=379 RepID=A0A7W6B6P0_9HYPH|nr:MULTISPECIES: adenylate/guanylate cyclase domain-containing protein [Rhizobium]MBB3134711.1 adenylate cyclase [Rhizobium pisi]MBB3914724.1 adenylate cyclase [Rhizobium fabae]RSB79339.1 adenylate/guanylate cyclase domain-containing protein [Rhizobium pisi]RUM14387.1 adenylate/guanylate cyclase domain-containing protein [Rhizobium fabae]TCA59493.1 adenylate/guanylate cyclase domain-containing protein [Rhizobium pisi]
MSTIESSVSSILLDRVAEWLTNSSLAGDDLENIVRGFCERIAAAGLPIARVHLSFSMLHPLYDALSFTWRRASGVTIEGFRMPAGQKPDRFLQSPYYYLLDNNLQHIRRRLMQEGPNEFPIFEDLRKDSITDYLAFVQPFGDGSVQGMMGSWSTDHHNGFSDDMIDALLRMQDHLAVAAKMAVLGKLANNMLTTYLGGDAGKRVLNGQIRRGDGETIRAALVMGDMRESTMYAEKEGRQAYIDTLNEFFDAIAAPFNRNGGEILSFLGDGFLAVYPCGRHKDPSKIACEAALSAVHQAQARVAELNNDREQKRLSKIGYGIGLHVGNVMFGNVGLKDRLTFSAFGSAVNEVQRLQILTKKYGREVVASQAFAGYCGGEWTRLGEEKLRGIRQKVTVLQPRAPTPEIHVDESFRDAAQNGISEAEQVILLHRDAKKQVKQTSMEKFIQ